MLSPLSTGTVTYTRSNPRVSERRWPDVIWPASAAVIADGGGYRVRFGRAGFQQAVRPPAEQEGVAFKGGGQPVAFHPHEVAAQRNVLHQDHQQRDGHERANQPPPHPGTSSLKPTP